MLDSHPHDTSPCSLEDILLRLGDTMNTVTLKLDKILHHLSPSSSSPNPQPTPIQPLPNPAPATLHKMKLEVPRFDGTEPLEWIFKINQYFEYHGTPERDRLTIASFYMEGRALAWFQWMTNNAQFTSWPRFLKAL